MTENQLVAEIDADLARDRDRQLDPVTLMILIAVIEAAVSFVVTELLSWIWNRVVRMPHSLVRIRISHKVWVSIKAEAERRNADPHAVWAEEGERTVDAITDRVMALTREQADSLRHSS